MVPHVITPPSGYVTHHSDTWDASQGSTGLVCVCVCVCACERDHSTVIAVGGMWTADRTTDVASCTFNKGCRALSLNRHTTVTLSLTPFKGVYWHGKHASEIDNKQKLNKK